MSRRCTEALFAVALVAIVLFPCTVTAQRAFRKRPSSLQLLEPLLPLQTALAGVGNVTTEDVQTPNLSTLIIETLEVISKPVFAPKDAGEKAVALQGLYTLWYFAGVSLGILPPLPGQQKDIVPHFAIDWPIAQSTSIKDGRLGYTNGTVLTWQNVEESIPVTAPGKVLVPSTVADVVAIVTAAAAVPGANIRCIAHGSTWTPVFFDEGATVLFISELLLPSGNRIELAGVDVDTSPLVRVAPGVTAGELTGWTDARQVMHPMEPVCTLAELNYSTLPHTTVYPVNRLSGVVAMGSHGKGLGVGCFADQVHSLKIVNGAGTIVEYTASHPQFNQAKVNFGLLGVIVEIVMKLSSRLVSPDKPLVYDNNTFAPIGNIFGRPDTAAILKELTLSSYSLEFLWFPLNRAKLPHFDAAAWDPLQDLIWTSAPTRVAVPTDGTPVQLYDNNQLAKPLAALEVATGLGWVLFEIGQQTRNLDIQALGATLEVFLLENFIVTNGTKTIGLQNHYEPALQQNHLWAMELVFKVTEDFSNVVEAIEVTFNITKEAILEFGSNPMNTVMEWRFTGASSIPLEASYGSAGDIFCWLELEGIVFSPFFDVFVKRVFDAWTAIGPTPPKVHWAKKNSYTEDQLLHAGVGPNNNDYWERYVQRTMEPYIATFRPVVAEADPAGLFRQKYLDNLFGIERS